MARLAVGVVFGLVVGVVAGAAVGIHAAGEGGMGSDVLTGVDGSGQDGGSVNAEPDPTVDAAPQQLYPEPPPSIYDTLAQCESNGRWSANTGNGFSGGLQFDAPTWLEFGGGAYASRAYLATRGQQIAVAQRLHAARGFAPWPVCSRRLGLR